MKNSISNAAKTAIMVIALINIVVMMLFEYGLPTLEASKKGNNSDLSVQESQSDTSEVGTIEAVEKEEASKETEAADSAIAKAESAKEEFEEEEERDPDEPLLELTDDHIYLNVGERFNYMSYIKTMEDVDGSDLSHYIYLDKDVNTYEPGEIDLTYSITSTITGKSASKVLHITIQE